MRVVAAAFVLFAGCAEISGLDSLELCDGAACGDATVDVAVEAPSTADATSDAPDASTDASDDPSTPPLADGSSNPCATPKDCVNGGVCCERFTLSGFQAPCTVDASTVNCSLPTACITSLPFSCTKAVARRCGSNADCTEASYDLCCMIPFDDASVHICANESVAVVAGGTCL